MPEPHDNQRVEIDPIAFRRAGNSHTISAGLYGSAQLNARNKLSQKMQTSIQSAVKAIWEIFKMPAPSASRTTSRLAKNGGLTVDAA